MVCDQLLLRSKSQSYTKKKKEFHREESVLKKTNLCETLDLPSVKLCDCFRASIS